MKLQGFEQALKIISAHAESEKVVDKVLQYLPNDVHCQVNKVLKCLEKGVDMKYLEKQLEVEIDNVCYRVSYNKKTGLVIDYDLEHGLIRVGATIELPTDRMLQEKCKVLENGCKEKVIKLMFEQGKKHLNANFSVLKNNNQLSVLLECNNENKLLISDLNQFFNSQKDRSF